MRSFDGIFLSRRNISGPGPVFGKSVGLQPTYVSATVNSSGQTVPTALDASTWAQRVMSTSQNGHVLFVVHGFNVAQRTFVGSLSSIRQMLQNAGYRGAVVGYDWPSDGSYFKYPQDWADACVCAEYLVPEGLELILRHRPTAKLHVLAHSMGSYVTTRALALATGTAAEAKLSNSLAQVAFTGSDADRAWFDDGAWGDESLRRCADRITNYWSEHDEALHASEDRYHPSTFRFGRHQTNHPVSSGVVSVECGPFYKTHYGQVIDPSFTHSWYYKDPTFFRDLLSTLRKPNSANYFTRRQSGNGHKVLQKA